MLLLLLKFSLKKLSGSNSVLLLLFEVVIWIKLSCTKISSNSLDDVDDNIEADDVEDNVEADVV